MANLRKTNPRTLNLILELGYKIEPKINIIDNKKYNVFISYSRKGTITVNKIFDALDKQGIKYFIDCKGLAGGGEFPAELEEAIGPFNWIRSLIFDGIYMKAPLHTSAYERAG